MPNETEQAVLEYRVSRLERTVDGDHEPRLRKVEGMTAKVAVFAAVGSIVGGSIVTAIISLLIK